MQLFFHENIQEPITVLGEDESKHLVKVLRKKKGDAVQLTDGKGRLYESVILDAYPKKTTLRILDHKVIGRDPFHIHLAIAPTKSPERMEWMVEKISEIGFHELSLFQSQNSERSFLKTERLHKKMVAACKQSLKLHMPVLKKTVSLDTLLHSADFEDYQKFIAYVDEHHRHHLMDLAKAEQKYLVLIGPEGDFSPKEIQDALKAGFQPVSLGSSRLRTETAGLAAVTMLQVLNR